MRMKKVSLGTAIAVAVVFVGAAAAFAWFFLRGKVNHTVAISDTDPVIIGSGSGSITYQGTPP